MDDEVSLIKNPALNITEEQKDVLYNRVEELRNLNATLLAENEMFERFISRLDPDELLSTVQDPGPAGEKGGGSGWRQKVGVVDHIHQLSLKQKKYVAQSEIIETQQEQEKLRQKYERIRGSYRASLKEAEFRLEDIRRAKSELERRLLKPLRDNRLETNEPEKILQYIRDKSKVNQLEKNSLKNQAMRVYEKKLQQQLQQRKDMGKAEYEEIFQDFSEQRIEINLDEVQVNSLKAQRLLSSHKEKLQRVTSELSKLNKDIKKKEQTLAKTEVAVQHAKEKCLKAQILKQHLRRQIAEYEAPDSSEYMHLKDKHRKLQQTILTWERKVGVGELALKTYSTAWKEQRATLTPVNSAATRIRSGERQFSVKLPRIAEHKDKAYRFQ